MWGHFALQWIKKQQQQYFKLVYNIPQSPQNRIKSETSIVRTVHAVNSGSSKEASLPPAHKNGGWGEGEEPEPITNCIEC